LSRPRLDPLLLLVAFAASAWLLGSAFLVPPTAAGDGGEYQLMTESLIQHLSPEVQPGDLVALSRSCQRFALALDFIPVKQSLALGENGRLYSLHFWGYSLVCLPAKILLRVLHLNDLRAGQITNAVALLAALFVALFCSGSPPRERLVLGLLCLFSPAAWFALWTHPETVCFSLVLVALVQAHAGKRHLPVLWAALAATQNPPLVFLVAPLWVAGACPRPGVDWRGRAVALAKSSAAALPILVPPVFFLAAFHTPNPLARDWTSMDLLSWKRALELLFDLNLGLLPYVPVALLLFCAAALGALLQPRRGAAALARMTLVLAMALASSVTVNWNHGTAGPSRYTIWMLPLIFTGAVEALSACGLSIGAWRGSLASSLAGLAVASQFAVVMARGGLRQPPDYLAHSYAARWVLHYAPRLYNPRRRSSWRAPRTRRSLQRVRSSTETIGAAARRWRVGGTQRRSRRCAATCPRARRSSSPGSDDAKTGPM
jgi:hypothetical protein